MYLELCNDDQAIMDVNFVQIGLAIASIILITASYIFIYENPSQVSSEIDAVAEEIRSMLNQVDSQWFETQFVFLFPDSFLSLNAEISSDFIRIKQLDSSYQYSLIPIPQTLWIVENTSMIDSSDDFHQLIKQQFGQLGTQDDPCLHPINVSYWFQNQYDTYQKRYHPDPLIWNRGRSILFEKCILFKHVSKDGNIRSIPFLEFIIVKKGLR